MATLFVLPKQAPVFSSASLPGALAYFFQPGTTTPIATYTTSALSVEHNHPVEAGADGVFPAIWINEATNATYRVQVKTSAEALKYDLDDQVARPNQASIGAALWPRTTAETNASVTPTYYYYEPGDIRRYGAAVDGTTLDTVAWQAAVDQCRAGGAGVRHVGGTSVTAQVLVGENTDIYIAANATVKFAPNQINFLRVFTSTGTYIYDAATDSRPLRIWGGGTIDGNQANQGTYTGGEKEQSHCIFLYAASTSGGRLVAFLNDIRCINSTGDGVQVYTNVDLTFSNLVQENCWRSGFSVTGGNTRVRGSNLRSYGATWGSDFDIEIDAAGYGTSYVVDVEIDGADLAGNFQVGTGDDGFSAASRVLLSNFNHRGIAASFALRGAVAKFSDSVITFGPISGSDNAVYWPTNCTFDNCEFVFSEGAVTATSTFGVYVAFNTGGTTDTGMRLALRNCRYRADSTVDAGDTVYGIYPTSYAAADDNVIEVYGGEFDSTLDDGIHLTAGGSVVLKNGPTFNCATALWLGYSGTYYYDVRIIGSPVLRTGVTSYMTMEQGNANCTVTHYDVRLDEAFNVITAGGGNPDLNTFRGWREIMVASAPDAATHGNVGDRAVIKAPAAGGVVEYVCTTRGWGSGAVWKALTTAAA